MEAETNLDDNVDNGEFLIVWESAVRTLTDVQRIIFFIIITIVVGVAICGNILVVYVNVFIRKQRFFFRTCLISLALSDLIYTVVTSTIYLPKMFISTPALWLLGPLACALLPFLQTMAVVVNSILLVCIACDRYMAVVRATKGRWEPGKLFCLTCCALIWGMAAGVSSPMLTLYDHKKVYIATNSPEGVKYSKAFMCICEKTENAFYFSVIFSFIFAPLLIYFLWLNSVVARAILIRGRRGPQISERSSNISTSNSENAIVPNIERHRRQVRLFRVLLLLMSVFFLCRLPAWIYTIYKLNNSADENIHWVLNYSFGILVLLNCALNPYLYSFMTETIRLVAFIGSILACKRDNGFVLST